MSSHPAQTDIGAASSVHRRALKTLLAAALVAWCGFFASGMAQATTPDAGTRSDQAAPSMEHYKHLRCPDSMFRIFPGAFDYCVATRHWARGKYAESLDMMKRAAAWGSKDAQLSLGIAYFNGDHVPANRPLGLAWLGLAAERKEEAPLQLLRSAYDKATPVERMQAQALMDAMWATYADYHAAVKADTTYRRAIRRIGERSVYGDGMCMAGLTVVPMGVSPDGMVGCPAITEVIRKLDRIYAETMRGWSGTVELGEMVEVRGKHLRMDDSASKPR